MNVGVWMNVCVGVGACTLLTTLQLVFSLHPAPPIPPGENAHVFICSAALNEKLQVQSSLSSHTSNIHLSPRKHLQENETQDFLPSPHLLPPRRDLLGRASRWPQLQLENSSPAKIQEDERHQEGVEGRRQELGQIDPELAGGTKLPKDLNRATNEKS